MTNLSSLTPGTTSRALAQPAATTSTAPPRLDSVEESLARLAISTPPAAPHRAAPSQATVPRPHAYDNAEMFGHKTANLVQLQNIVASCSHLGAGVPQFCGISHGAVISHLQTHLGPTFAAQLQTLTEQIREQTHLTPGAKVALAAIRQSIDGCLARHPLPLDYAWLHRQQTHAIMVRSSGHEDTAQTANAGGNASVANVPPNDRAALGRAVSETLTSYFGERSFQQRLAAGDPVEALPMMPLLLQRMVEPTSAGVLFTLEPEGPTPGVSQIQAAWGHNEAVVASLLPVDSFYVGDASLYKAVQRKPKRMVAGAASQLETVANAPNQRMQASISDATARRLHDIGKVIAAHFGCPMDIEWLYDADADIIWVVQARPQILPEGAQASHLQAEKINALPRIDATVVGAAGGEVRVLGGTDQVIVANSLAQALQQYLNHPQAAQIQCVCIEEAAASTSHEAITLRAARMPVLQVPQAEALMTLLREHSPVLLDCASGALVGGKALGPWDLADDLKQHLTEAGVIVPGWGSHPLPAQMTVQNGPMDVTELHNFLRELLIELDPSGAPKPSRDVRTPQKDLVSVLKRLESIPHAPLPKENTLPTLLNDVMAEDPRTRATSTAAILRITYQLTRLIAKDQRLQPRAEALLRSTVTSLRRVHEAAANSDADITLLYEHNWLQAALLQQSNAIVGGDSFVTLLAEYRKGNQATQPRSGPKPMSGALAKVAALFCMAPTAPPSEPPPSEYLVTFQQVAKLSLRPEVAEAWNSFIADLTRGSNASSQERLAKMLVQLHELGVTGEWLNTLFIDQVNAARSPGLAAAQSPHAAAVACLQSLEQVLGKSNPGNAMALLWAQQAHQTVAQWQGRIAEWSNPTAFEALLGQFETQILELLRVAPQRYDAADPLGKTAVLRWLMTTVDMFDCTIKSVTGSPETAHKEAHFARLLKPYVKLAQPWVERTPEIFSQAVNYRAKGARQTLRDMLKLVDDRVAAGLRPDDLLASQSFSVTAARLGSGQNYRDEQPKTLEDIFTLAHQNMLAIGSALNASLCIKTERLPDSMQRLLAGLARDDLESALQMSAVTINLVGIRYNYPELQADLNITLDQHGLGLTVKQVLNSDAPLEIQSTLFSGRDENLRIERVKLYAALFATALKIPFHLQTTSVGRSKATWTWQAPTDGPQAERFAALLPKCLEGIANTTFYPETIESVLQGMARYLPETAHVLENLPSSFFVEYPWFNHEFIALDWFNGTLYNVLPALLANSPEQNVVWDQLSALQRPSGMAQPVDIGIERLLEVLDNPSQLAQLKRSLPADDLAFLAQALVKHRPEIDHEDVRQALGL